MPLTDAGETFTRRYFAEDERRGGVRVRLRGGYQGSVLTSSREPKTRTARSAPRSQLRTPVLTTQATAISELRFGPISVAGPPTTMSVREASGASLEEDARAEDAVAARRAALAVGPAAGRRGLGHSGRVRASPCPDLREVPSFGFSSTATFKAWVGSVVLALAAAQAGTALWLYGRLPGTTGAPRWLRPRPSDDRVRGVRRVAAGGGVLPVRPGSPRRRCPRAALPRWALPVTGALLLTAVVVAWLTSALWLFSVAGLHL